MPRRYFVSGSYKCECRQGYEYPFNDRTWYFHGEMMEREYQLKLAGEPNRFDLLRCRQGLASTLRHGSIWTIVLSLSLRLILSFLIWPFWLIPIFILENFWFFFYRLFLYWCLMILSLYSCPDHAAFCCSAQTDGFSLYRFLITVIANISVWPHAIVLNEHSWSSVFFSLMNNICYILSVFSLSWRSSTSVREWWIFTYLFSPGVVIVLCRGIDNEFTPKAA